MEESEVGENSTAWNILRDDFMMGAKMKDWDKQTSDNVASSMPLDRNSDNSESDNDDSDDYS